MFFTREMFGMALLLFCLIVMLAICSGSAIFAGFGQAICYFMYGTFGYGSFFVVFLLACLGVWLTFEKRIKIKVRPALFLSLTVYMLFLLFHSVSTRDFTVDGSYISACYDAAASAQFSSYTFGGVLSAILVYPVASLTTFIGAYIIFSLLTVLCAYFTIKSFRKHYSKGAGARTSAKSAVPMAKQPDEVKPSEVQPVSAESVYQATESPVSEQVQPYAGAAPQYDQTSAAAYDDGLAGQYVQPSYPQQYESRYDAPVEDAYQGYGQDFGASSQPYGDYQNGSAPVQTYSDHYAEYLRNQEAYNNAIHGISSSESDSKYSRDKLGNRIIFDRDEFAAESYRRNGIFDENSYFNQPVKTGNKGGYISGFTGNKPSAGTKIEPVYTSSGAAKPAPAATPAPSVPVSDVASAASARKDSQNISQSASAPSTIEAASNPAPTYTAAYQRSIENTSAPSVPGMIYGDAPVDKLVDEPSGIYSSYKNDTVAENFDSHSAVSDTFETDAPETEPDFHDDFDDGLPVSDRSDELPARDEKPDRIGPVSSDERRIDDVLFGHSRGADSTFPRRTAENSVPDDDEDLIEPRGEFDGELSDDFGGLDLTRRSSRFSDDGITRSSAPSGEEPDRKIVGFGEPSGGSSLRQTPPAESSRGDDSSSGLFRSRGDSAPSDGGRAGGLSSLFSSSNSRLGESRIEPDSSRLSRPRQTGSELFGGDSAQPRDQGVLPSRDMGMQRGMPQQPQVSSNVPAPLPERQAPSAGSSAPLQQTAEEQKPPHVWKKYVRPPMDLLDEYPEYTAADSTEIEQSKRIILETLEGFRVGCEMSNVVVGPAITRFDVIIQDRTNIKNSLKYRESIAMALKKENVNVYLNYSKGALSIEVPNAKRSVVGLKAMMRSTAYTNAKPNSLTFALGKNVEGACICPDITKMPHLLVAGTTGSGKSICLSSLLISLLYKYGPEDLRFILVDPKQVEFISYDKLPHLMINEIIYDVDKAIKALNWAIKEMERRYSLFKDMTETGANAKGGVKVATKDINEYNSHLEEGQEKLPKIVIVLDEFGDLMLQAKKDIESRIIKLVQKARAAGIHLILATQRPSVDCITGLIKSNLPTRIGFKVGSFDDSRTIFDVGGAEKLLGKGDMYFRSAERPELMRIQGCFVDTPEVQRVTDFIKQHNETYFDQSVSDFINKVEEPEQVSSISDSADGGDESKIDDTYLKALKFCVTSNAASVSMIQRRFPIGYMKACKIIDWMENMNYVTKSEGSKARKVLLSLDEFINTYGDIDD